MQLVNTYIMKKKLTIIILCFISISIYGQEKILSGILEDKGEPILFASVAVYRNGVLVRGTDTDLDGKYKVLCMPGDEIEASYIGYTPKRFTVTPDMLEAINTTKMKKVTSILASSFSQAIRKRKIKWDSLKQIDKGIIPRSYKIANVHSHYNTTDISIDGDYLKFTKPKESIKYNIDLKQTVGVSYISNKNIHRLQNQYGQGRPVDGVFLQADGVGEVPFSWDSRIETNVPDNNLISPSTFSSTQMKADVVIGSKRHYFSFTRKAESDIFRAGNQEITRGKIGMMNYSQNSHVLITEVSATHTKLNNHNTSGYYQNVLRSMMVQSPSFDSTRKIDNEFVAFSPSFNNPRWLLANNTNELKRKNISLFIQHKNHQWNRNFQYSNALKLEADYIDIVERISAETIGVPQGSLRMFEFFYPKLSLVSNVKKYIQRQQKAYLYLDNFMEAEYLRFRASDSSSEEFSNQLYRASPRIGVNLNHNTYRLDVAYQPIISSIQPTDWLSSNFDFTYLINTDKKYLDRIDLKSSYQRRAKNQDLFLNRTNYSAQAMNSFDVLGSTIDRPLFLPSDLANEISETIKVAIGFTNRYHSNTLQTSLTFRNLRQSDVIFPVREGDNFVMRNVGSFTTNAIEWRSDVNLRKRNRTLSYNGQLNIIKYRTNVTDTNQNSDVIISGFSNVSKQFVEDQPIGIIVGNDYHRDEDGKLIIGQDGFPTLDTENKIIGDPTPMLVGEMNHRIGKGKYSFSVNIDGQLGGEVWNGTQQALDYYGVSQYTADQREVTDFIFDGVDINGNINTKKVALADPSLGLSGNRWTRYGEEGVASDYIIDASYLRLKRVAFGYTKTIDYGYASRQIVVSLFATNLLTFAPFEGFTTNYLFEDDLSSGLQYFNQPMTSQVGISAHFKL